MVKKSVVDYVAGMLGKGYSLSAIREVMLKYGYTNNDVDEAINEAYHPTIHHEIHLGASTIIVIMILGLSLIGAGLFIYYPQSAPKALLDLSLEPVSTAVAPGQNAVFITKLSNLGSSKRYDVPIKYQITDAKTSKLLTQTSETRAIETFGSLQTQVKIPDDSKPGDYILTAIADYDSKEAKATLPVKVVSGEGAKPSCFDGIKNQDENSIDCGGVCGPCKKSENCDDKNSCTNDSNVNGNCVHNPITPCCGNGICEAGETEKCPEDCRKTETLTGYDDSEAIEEIKLLAKTDPAAAMQKCSQIKIIELKDTCISKIGEAQQKKEYCSKVTGSKTKDLCYSNIAKLANDNSVCDDISNYGVKDSCYMTFVLDNDDFSVCGKFSNKQLGDSCEYLRRIKSGQQTHEQ